MRGARRWTACRQGSLRNEQRASEIDRAAFGGTYIPACHDIHPDWREPDKVREDLLNEMGSFELAREIYGVIPDRVNLEAGLE